MKRAANPFIQVLLVIVGWLSQGPAFGQTVPYKDVSGSFLLSAHSDYFVDSSGKLTIKDIAQNDQIPFQSLAGIIPNFGYTKDTFWFRFKLSGIPEHASPLVLLFGYALLDDVTLYLPQENGGFLRKKSGRHYPIPDRELKNRLPSFLFQPTPTLNDKDIYIRVRTSSSAQLSMTLVPLLEYANHDHDFQFANALYFGAMAIMSIYNLIFYAMTRQNKYGYYVLFVASSSLLVMAIYGYNFEYLWPRAVRFNKHAMTLTVGLVLFSISFFYGSSLKILERKPRLRLLTYAFGWIGFALGFMSFVMPYSLAVKSIMFYLILMSVYYIGLSLYLSLLRHRSAYFYLLAFSGLIMGTMVYILQAFGLILGNYWTVLAPQIGSAMQVVLLSFALADQFREIKKEKEEAQKKLLTIQDEHIRSLDGKVEEKTRDIRSILSTITQGIFTIGGGNAHRINPEYSEFLKVIVGTEDIEGRDPIDLLFQNSTLPREKISQMENVLEYVLNEDELAFSTNANHLVSEFERVRGNERHYFDLDWTPVLNDEGNVSKILVTVRDVTRLKILERKAAEQSKEMEIIKELLGATAVKTQRFLVKARSYLGTCLKAMSVRSNAKSLDQVFIMMHTLKGDARTLGLTLISSQVHELEDRITVLQKEAPHEGGQLVSGFQALLSLVEDFEKVQREKLNHTQDDDNRPVPLHRLEEILDPLQQIMEEDIQSRSRAPFLKVKDLLYAICHESLDELFEDLTQPLGSTAKYLGKQTPDVQCRFQEKVYIRQELREALSNAFVHIFRNSLDHGIEDPAQRESLGKSPQGHIMITGRVLHGGLRIDYQDDGQGLNLDKILNKALERDLISRSAVLSDGDVAQLIFAPGFSTSDEVNEISGRGVGMSAARSFLESIGATLEIELKAYENRKSVPFRLIITIPNTGALMAA